MSLPRRARITLPKPRAYGALGAQNRGPPVTITLPSVDSANLCLAEPDWVGKADVRARASSTG
jgi:hypothetical protein